MRRLPCKKIWTPLIFTKSVEMNVTKKKPTPLASATKNGPLCDHLSSVVSLGVTEHQTEKLFGS